MKSISLRTKVVTGIVTGGMILSSVSLAFAGNAKPSDTDRKPPCGNECKQLKTKLEEMLKFGVSSNIITQDESDKILAYENTKIEARDKETKDKTKRADLFKELVDKGILTQEKSDALKASIRDQRDNERQQQLDSKLEGFVADKTITQDQATKIKDALIKNQAERKADFEKTKTMTEEQRKEYMDSKKANPIDPLKTLVDDGTITQEQADKIGHGRHGMPNGHGHKGSNQATPNTNIE